MNGGVDPRISLTVSHTIESLSDCSVVEAKTLVLIIQYHQSYWRHTSDTSFRHHGGQYSPLSQPLSLLIDTPTIIQTRWLKLRVTPSLPRQITSLSPHLLTVCTPFCWRGDSDCQNSHRQILDYSHSMQGLTEGLRKSHFMRGPIRER